MYERLEQCPSCKHTKFANQLICQDNSVSGESFALVKCENCTLVFTNPRPTPAELDKYYESPTYISHTDKANSIINLIYKTVRSYTLGIKRSLIERYRKQGTVLDYGAGTGDFLRVCQKTGWTVSGVEPNESARHLAQSKINQKLQTSLEKVQGAEFDIITAWHVIEHVTDLLPTLKRLKKLLAKNGYMIIALPNFNSYDSLYYKEHWAAYDVPRHLYHFTQSSFSSLAKSLDMQLVDTLPMKFDSYYVSMLSEKYRTNKNRFVSAFANGYKSNRLASKSGEYSSLTYVLKKKN